MGGTLLSKKEKRSAKGNTYAFLNFSDLSSIYELIIFESNLRKYRDMLIEGDSFVLGIDFSSHNGTLRGELKKVFKIEEVDKLNNKKINTAKFHMRLKIIKIYGIKFFKSIKSN